ncbi:MAG: histone deacetylase [Deltaproteobacteria bacterium]|nr:histone deacetylase [Deltaproteobacteria bacterium]
MSNITGIFFHKNTLLHKVETDSAENPQRISWFEEYQKTLFRDRYRFFEPYEIDEYFILRVHSRPYLDQIHKYMYAENPYCYDRDTYLMPQSLESALCAASGSLALVEGLMWEECNNAFSLIRPPGHHAETGRGMGFCIFNNAALCAKHLIEHHRLNKILILDLDAHHGNGTQDIFYESNQVLYCSIHQKNIFPFTGSVTEVGNAVGIGYNVNIPVYAGYGDSEYTYIMGKVIQNIFEQFLPQFVIISMGFDGHENDSISELKLTTSGYQGIISILKSFGKKYGPIPMLYILEGGYNLLSLRECIISSLDTLSSSETEMEGFGFSPRAEKFLEDEVRPEISRYWSI